MNQVMRLSKSVCSRGVFGAALLAGMVLFIGNQSGYAQSTGGRVRGTVTDPSGSAVVGATVTLINTATNVSRDTTSGAILARFPGSFSDVACSEDGRHVVAGDGRGGVYLLTLHARRS